MFRRLGWRRWLAWNLLDILLPDDFLALLSGLRARAERAAGEVVVDREEHARVLVEVEAARRVEAELRRAHQKSYPHALSNEVPFARIVSDVTFAVLCAQIERDGSKFARD